jgi:hypothetical protein
VTELKLKQRFGNPAIGEQLERAIAGRTRDFMTDHERRETEIGNRLVRLIAGATKDDCVSVAATR